MDDRVLVNEIEWHRRNVAGVVPPDRMSEHEIAKYRDCTNWRINSKQMMFKRMAPLQGKRVLDFGCGQGVSSVQLAALGAVVDGFDLCPELVEESILRARANNVGDRCRFVAGEASAFQVQPESYDVVLIDNVLHHIPREDHTKICETLMTGLKPGGTALFREPVQFSWVMRILKRVIPYHEYASPDERELSIDDFRVILRAFPQTEIYYYALTGRLAKFLKNARLNDLSMRADVRLFRISFLRRFAGEVVIIAHKPAVFSPVLRG